MTTCTNTLGKLLFICIINCLVACSAEAQAVAADRLIRLTSGEWPPYMSSTLDNSGTTLKVIREAYALEGYTVEYGFFPWKRSYEMAKESGWDGTAAWIPSRQREEEFLFSDAVAVLQYAFFRRVPDTFTYSSLADLQGKRLGLTRGYLYAPDFPENASKHGAKLLIADSDLINIRLLLAGRVDLIINDPEVVRYLLAHEFQREEADQIQVCQQPLINSDLAVLFPKGRPRSEELRDTLNRGLRKLLDAPQQSLQQ